MSKIHYLALALLAGCSTVQPPAAPPAAYTPCCEADKHTIAAKITDLPEYAVYEESTESFRHRLQTAGYYWKDTQATYHLMDGDGCSPTRLFILTADGKLHIAMAEVEEHAHLGTSVCEITPNPEAPFGREWHTSLCLDTLILAADNGQLPPPGVWQKLLDTKH